MEIQLQLIPQPPQFGDPRLPRRFWDKVDPNGPLFNGTPCWLWKASTAKGYGHFRASRKVVYAHRLSYETLIEPIPKGLEPDHLCRNTTCVNPHHIEPVT